MSATNPNESAYPQSGFSNAQGEVFLAGHYFGEVNGLTKREAFAMAAMQGLCANSHYATADCVVIAGYAVSQADALIEELNREGTDQ